MSEFFDQANPLSPHDVDARQMQLLRDRAKSATVTYPLTHGQQAMWYTHHLATDGVPYNTAFVTRIGSPVDVTALHQSWQTLVDRHGALRTTFTIRDGQLVQEVHGSQVVDFAHLDVASCSDAEVRERVRQAYGKPFDLEPGPLMRVRLFTQAPQSHILLFVAHHIIIDAWSQWRLLEDLRLLYPARRLREAVELPPPTSPYPNYVQWQADLLESKGERLWHYWREQLSGALPLLNLPTDRPRPPAQTFRGASELIRFPHGLVSGLRRLAAASHATMYQVMLAAWQVLLHRYSGQDDILVGSPVASGRMRREFVGTVGYFNDILVLRSDLSGNPPFTTFLQQVRKTVLQGLLHQDYPFSVLVERLQVRRDPSYSPLFQVALVIDRPPQALAPLVLGESEERVSWGGLELAPYEMGQQEGLFDLLLMLLDGSEEFFGFLTYKTDLFDASTIERLGRHLLTLLEAIVTDPSQGIEVLPLLTPADRQDLLTSWNATETGYPAEVCLPELFEAQVARKAEAVAVVGEGESLTYRGLNTRANQLAAYLRALGIGPETVVGVCLERSPETVVCLLAIFKAGGVYLPLEPTLPPERLRFMLLDAQVQVVLTDTACAANLPAELAKRVDLDTMGAALIHYPGQNPPSCTTPQNLAYIIYTSGSTGLPKGAMVTQQGMINHLYAKVRDLELSAADRVAQTAPQSFDISIWQLLVGLLVGGTVHIIDADTVRTPPDLLTQMEDQHLTILEVVPSLFRVLLDELESRGSARPAFADLRWLLLTGEALPPGLCQTWFAQYPAIPLMNAYGPTECSDDVTHHALTRPLPSEAASVPIGRAVANTQLYIVDGEMQPTPLGVPGELVVGGLGVGRGYVQDGARTATAFVPDPFGSVEGACLYKTGDLARYRPDGTIEFLGRLDYQVKIRGFRIELGEIEARLDEHAGVRESLVLAQEDGVGSASLVAYLVPQGEPAPPVSALREYLHEQVPDYMVPSAFVFLDAFPLSANGKVDRQALPAPDASSVAAARAYEAPRTATEKTLVAVWKDLLGLERVGIHDNFFELGGDSILSIQIVARANQAGLHLVPRQMFQHQTVAALADVVTEAVEISQAEQGVVTGSAPLTPIQQWYFEHLQPDSHHFNQSMLIMVSSEVNPAWLEAAVTALLRHHDALRLRFTQQAQGWSQMQGDVEASIPFTVLDLSALAAADRQARVEAEMTQLHASLNLATGPLLRVALFVFDASEPSRLAIVIHHLAVDGVSWRILLDDFEHAYQQVRRGEAVHLRPKTTSFRAWAHWLAANGPEAVAHETAYWQGLVGHDAGGLPVDYPAGVEANTVASAADVSCALSVHETEVLLREVPSVYHTQINDVLLTALMQSVCQWTGASSVFLQLEGHGREVLEDDTTSREDADVLDAGIDLSRTVGWFTSLFPVVLERVHEHPDEALKSVKEQLRRIPSRGIGYGILRYLGRASELASRSQAELSFNYLGQIDLTHDATSDGFILGFASEAHGSDHSPLHRRPCLLDVNALVVKGQLQVNWAYSRNVHKRETIAQLAQAYIETLRALIAHCLSPQAGGYTPSDFSAARLDQSELDALLNKLEGQAHNIEDIYKLSPMQEVMLFETLDAPESGVYTTQSCFALDDRLDPVAFRQAWQQVVDRHSVLRTVLVWEDRKRPFQVVRQQMQLPWESKDWREVSDPQAQLQAFLELDHKVGFEMAGAPLMRCTLIRTAAGPYYFICTIHHILVDAWSLPIILQDVLRCYEAAVQRQTVQLIRSRPYGDYIAWLQRQDVAQAELFWRQAFQGLTTPPPLVKDPVTEQQARYEEHHLYVSARLSDALKSMAQQHHLTLNTLLQGAWALLLSRYSGGAEAVFGVTVASRPPDLPGMESMVGAFINSLPLRVSMPEEAELLPWLRQLMQRQVEMEQYAYVSLDMIRQWSEMAPDRPLFESNVRFQNYPLDEPRPQPWGGGSHLTIDTVRMVDWWHYPLDLGVIPQAELLLLMTYDCRYFDSETITQFLENMQTLLSAFVSDPQQRLKTLRLMIGHHR